MQVKNISEATFTKKYILEQTRQIRATWSTSEASYREAVAQHAQEELSMLIGGRNAWAKRSRKRLQAS